MRSRWHYDVRRNPSVCTRLRVVDAVGQTVNNVVAVHRQTGGLSVRVRVGFGYRSNGTSAGTIEPVERNVWLPGARLEYVDMQRHSPARRTVSDRCRSAVDTIGTAATAILIGVLVAILIGVLVLVVSAQIIEVLT